MRNHLHHLAGIDTDLNGVSSDSGAAPSNGSTLNDYDSQSGLVSSTPDPENTLAVPNVPAQALANGYTTATFNDDFDAQNDVSTTVGTTANWYTWNGYDPNDVTGLNLTSSDYSIADSTLDITNQLSYSGLSSIDSTHPAISTPTSHAVNEGGGLAFQYGYFEASIAFTSTGTGDTFPAFWSNAVGALTGQTPYDELDFFEAYPDKQWSSSGVDIIGTAHQWYAGGAGFSNANNQMNSLLPSGLNLSDFNTYGVLWTPTEVSWYINNKEIISIPTTTPTQVIDTSGQKTMNTFSALNTSANYLELGAGPNSPMQVAWVHVFQ
jgi:beta-glucanase (GH16 family)